MVSKTSRTSAVAASRDKPGGGSCRAMSTARSRACGSARSCIHPCSSLADSARFLQHGYRPATRRPDRRPSILRHQHGSTPLGGILEIGLRSRRPCPSDRGPCSLRGLSLNWLEVGDQFARLAAAADEQFPLCPSRRNILPSRTARHASRINSQDVCWVCPDLNSMAMRVYSGGFRAHPRIYEMCNRTFRKPRRD
jgi:hypothetical protein